MSKRRRSFAASTGAVLVAAGLAAVLGHGSAAAAPAASAAKCAKPTKTTVSVTLFEYGYTLKPASVHCGTVTFKQKNTGAIPHNFDIQGVKAGKLLNHNQTSSFTVKLMKTGKFSYLCDVLGHASLGMVGNLTVKG